MILLNHMHSEFGAKFVPDKRPWEVPVDLAMPCATENEVNLEDARNWLKMVAILLAEASNMGCTADAVEYLAKLLIMLPERQ